MGTQRARTGGQLGWVRVGEQGAEGLRRGAWYEVLEERPDGGLVVNVHGAQVSVHRSRVSVVPERPREWSVVVRVGVLRPTWANARHSITTTYSVCPSCQHRQEMRDRPVTLACDRCKQSFPVDWSATC